MATSLTRFTTPFRPAPTFFTGTSTGSSLVPNVFPVAINGRPYMIDTASNQFSRQFDARVRDSVDQSTEPGEAALNPQGLWRRSQSSWHYGAGQQYSDAADAEAYRFYDSKGVDVWTRNRLKLLPDVTKVYPSSGTPGSNMYMTTADGRIYLTDGQTVKYTTDFATFTTVTSTNASNLVDITSDGYNVFFSYADGNIDQTNTGTSVASDYITGINAGRMNYVKGRLMVAGQGADKNKIWNITTTPGTSQNNPGALYTHPNTNFEWHGFAAGQNHIYAAGHAGNKTIVYKTVIKADGTGLDVPTVAAELPLGEICETISGYLSYILIGLEDGFRLCSSDGDGNLVVGPKISTPGPVEAFSGVGQYIYFSWKNFDSTSTGIGRMDISVFVSPNQPAYASDLMVTGQGAITDIHEFNNKPVFAVASLGIYTQHATNLVERGYLRTGIYRWGVPDAKYVPKLDLRSLPLKGSVVLAIASDGQDFTEFNAYNTEGETSVTIDGNENKVFEAELKISLFRSATNNAEGPTITRLMARAYAAPLRSQIFQVPLLMHHRLIVGGREYFQNVDTELNYLRNLVEEPRIVNYQENEETFPVVVENVQMVVRQLTAVHNANDFEGTVLIVMRSVR